MLSLQDMDMIMGWWCQIRRVVVSCEETSPINSSESTFGPEESAGREAQGPVPGA